MITRKEMTRRLLKEGLLSCLENHSFESVTVTLLCKTSGITRSTFYLHYSNITVSYTHLTLPTKLEV